MELFKYTGQTTDELLALEHEVSEGELIFALEKALDEKVERAIGPTTERARWATFVEQIRDVAEGRTEGAVLNEEELVVLAIVALEREVRNGGYDQLFVNYSVAFTPIFTKALLRVGRPDVAAVTQEAIDSVGIDPHRFKGVSYVEALGRAIRTDNDERDKKLSECDDRFYAIAMNIVNEDAEDLLDVSLWNFIKANRDKIKVP